MTIYLVCYDIESNKLRSKISRKLQDFGLERIQYSVYLGSLSLTLRQRLQQVLSNIFVNANLQQDKLLIIPITDAQLKRHLIFGNQFIDIEYISGKKKVIIL